MLLTTWYPDENNPMAGIFVQEQAKAIQLYNDVIVVHHQGWEQDLKHLWKISKEENPEFTATIPTLRLKWRLSKIPRLSYLYFIVANLAIIRYLKNNGFNPDVIHAHIYTAGVPAIILGWLYHIPVVITEHSTAFPRQLLSRDQLWQARFALYNADKVVVVSHSLQVALENAGIHRKFQIISNTVDQEVFYPADPPHKVGVQKRLLFVNAITVHKGLEDLLMALYKINLRRNDWHLDIIGDGPQKFEYERLTASLGLVENITFRGYLPKQRIAEIMRQADLFILPSHIETFSVVTAEALCCGLPVLATQCGGPEEYISPAVGRIVPPRQPEFLSKELEWMMDHLGEFSSSEIRDYSTDRFSLMRIGNKYHSLYESLITIKNNNLVNNSMCNS